MKKVPLSIILYLVGVILVIYGAYRIDLAWAIIVLGAVAVAVGWMVEQETGE